MLDLTRQDLRSLVGKFAPLVILIVTGDLDRDAVAFDAERDLLVRATRVKPQSTLARVSDFGHPACIAAGRTIDRMVAMWESHISTDTTRDNS